MVPTNAIYNAGGTYANTPLTGGAVGVVSHNFILSADYAKITSVTNQLIGSAALTYKITPQLIFRPTVNLDYRIIKGDYYADPRIQDAYSVGGGTRFRMKRISTSSQMAPLLIRTSLANMLSTRWQGLNIGATPGTEPAVQPMDFQRQTFTISQPLPITRVCRVSGRAIAGLSPGFSLW